MPPCCRTPLAASCRWVSRLPGVYLCCSHDSKTGSPVDKVTLRPKLSLVGLQACLFCILRIDGLICGGNATEQRSLPASLPIIECLTMGWNDRLSCFLLVQPIAICSILILLGPPSRCKSKIFGSKIRQKEGAVRLVKEWMMPNVRFRRCAALRIMGDCTGPDFSTLRGDGVGERIERLLTRCCRC